MLAPGPNDETGRGSRVSGWRTSPSYNPSLGAHCPATKSAAGRPSFLPLRPPSSIYILAYTAPPRTRNAYRRHPTVRGQDNLPCKLPKLIPTTPMRARRAKLRDVSQPRHPGSRSPLQQASYRHICSNDADEVCP